MRLLKWNDGDVCLVDAPEEIPPYAVLSHTWGPKNTEVTFEDVIRKAGKSKVGYKKIWFCGQQAQRDGLEYFWIDTCCIDKSSSAELSKSLNSMFKWYQDSETCYVYLSDVSENQNQPGWELAFRKCKWFTRGWTLQELLAPAKIKLFSRKAEYLGDKQALGQLIHDITKIPLEALHGSCSLSKFTIKDRCAWMNGRDTTEPEDQAYALLGIVDAYLPLMYGHGKDKAMFELHESIHTREKLNISIAQVDEYLSSHHYSNERLRIQRLSGENLDMNSCYINLAVLRHMSEDNTASGNKEASPFDILSRLQVDGRDADHCVELAEMFDSRRTSQGHMKAPGRILIRGRAGVGKTTLCKKIVFEFERRNLWNDVFDRVLWLPLRTLKTWSRDSLTLVDLFHYHYFRDDPRFGHSLAENLGAEVQLGPGSRPGSRTLFILDGLDEVTETWNIDEPMHEFLAKLLDQPNVIITSRPHAQLPLDVGNPIDLELETVGFQPKQVDEYLEMALPNPKDIKEIQNFLQRFAIVQGLARIPILLDALCYIWNDNAGNNSTLQSMTNFYQYVQQQLMIKDSVRLGKRKASVASDMGALQLEDCFKDEIELLEQLAFTGMVNDMIEFEPKTRHAMLRAFKSESERILPDQSIRHLSFLRTSGPHKKGANVNYHFLHLTFQEFFAASYFVRQWISESEDFVYYLDLKQGKSKKQETISSFLAQHKYNPRYNIFWRFVAGLLDDEQNGDEVANFFHAIEEYQSRDLLGPAHQRLVLHCLNEVSENLTSRRDLEKRLKAWLVFEIESFRHSSLAREMEVPDHVVLDILRQGGPVIDMALPVALDSRVNLSSSVQRELLDVLEREHPSRWRSIVARTLGRHLTEPKVQEELLARLDDKDPDIQCAVIDTLSYQASEPEVKKALLARLDDRTARVRKVTANALACEAGDIEVQQALQARLDDEESVVRGAAAIALSRHTSDPRVRHLGITALNSENGEVAWDLLWKAMLAPLFGDEDPRVQTAAALGLKSQTSDPKVQQVSLAQLSDQDVDVRQNAANVLRNRADEPEVQEALLARLSDENAMVRRYAASALRSHASEPKVQQALLARLNDNEEYIQSVAFRTLLRYQNKPFRTFSAEERSVILRNLFKMSFSQPFSWQVRSGVSFLYTPWGLIKSGIADTESLCKIVELCQPDGYPPNVLQHAQPDSSFWSSSLQWMRNLFS